MAIHCPNKNLKEFKDLVASVGEARAYYEWNKTEGKVGYSTKLTTSVNKDLDKIVKLFKQIGNNDTFWGKLQKDFAIPKEQVNLLKDSEGKSFEDKLLNFVANYSYTVEINTAKANKIIRTSIYYPEENQYMEEEVLAPYSRAVLQPDSKYKIILVDSFGEEFSPGAYTKEEAISEFGKEIFEETNLENTQHYSNLTVPGGTNYTENEVSTPAITPSIKGHAQFATDKGIGWFRSDDKSIIANSGDVRTGKNYLGEDISFDTGKEVSTKTRRILEVQSDLFQKGRDKESLILNDDEETKKKIWQFRTLLKNRIETLANFKRLHPEQLEEIKKRENEIKGNKAVIEAYEKPKQNQFLQLLNKDNNWVTFFVKSIIQDSAKKGYEKVLFPVGDTAAKIEGHQTVQGFIDNKGARIKELRKERNDLEDYGYEKLTSRNIDNTPKKEQVQKRIDNINNEITQLKKEIEDAKAGKLKISNIAKFYEETVFNILKKQGYNPVKITDEYGNGWYEVGVTDNHLNDISFRKNGESETKVSKAVLVEIADKLKAKLGVDYKIVSSEEAKKLAKDPNYNGRDPFYHSDGKVYIVEGEFTLETPLHEFAHPFVRAIAKNNAKLFESILKSIINSEEGQEIYDTVEELYPEDFKNGVPSVKAYEEIAVRALTELSKKNVNPNTGKPFISAIKRLITQFKLLFRELFGKDIKVSELDENTTLQELADMLTITAGNIDLKSLKGKTYGSYQVVGNMPFQDSTIEKMESGEQSITIRPKNHTTGIYTINGIKYHVENLGLKTGTDFKDKDALKEDFKGSEYVEGKFKHIDDFFKGTEKLYVYQITKLDEQTEKKSVSYKKSLDLKAEQQKKNREDDAAQKLRIVVDKIKDVLIKQKAIFKKKSNSKAFVEDLDKVLKSFDENSDDITAVLKFVHTSHTYINQLYDRFNALKDKLEVGEDLTPFERNNALNLINKIKELNASYDVLDELDLIFNGDTSSATGSDYKVLSNAISRKNKLTRSYTEVGVDLVADWLYQEAIEVNDKLQAEGKSKYILSKDKIKDELIMSSSDIGLFSSMFGAAINSTDPITALAAKSIKRKMTESNTEDLDIFEDLVAAFEESGAPSIEDNKKYIHEIEHVTYVEGKEGKFEKIVTKAKALITKFKTDLFEEEKSKFFSTLGTKPADPKEAKEYSKKVAKWFNENTQVKGNAQSIVEDKRKEMSPEDFESWFKENTRTTENTHYADGTTKAQLIRAENPSIIASSNSDIIYMYSGEFIIPSAKYINSKYTELSKDKYYNKLLDTYTKANNRLPINRRLKHGLLPQIPKASNEKSVGDRFSKANLKNAVNFTAYDTKYEIQTLSGEDYKQVQVKYTGKIDESLVSENLLESVLKFSQMANNHKHMSEIKANVDMLMTLIGERTVVETNSLGQQVKDAVTKKLRTKNKSEAKKVNERLKNFIDMAFYGEEELKSSFSMFGKEYSINKLAGGLQYLTALSSMAFNLTSGVSNVLWGNYQTYAQSLGGKNYTSAQWVSALGHYSAHIPMYLGDLGKRIGKSKDNQLIDIFEAIQGEFKDQYGNKVSNSAAMRLFSSDSLFFTNNAGEHQIQTTSMIAILKNHKVKNSAGEEISLYDAYTLEGHRYKLKSGIKFSESDKFAVMNEIHAVNKKLHGNYNTFDKGELQRHWYGKMAMMFRKHIYNGVLNRYGKERLDVESGEVEEGYYRSFMSKLYKDTKEFGITGAIQWDTYTPEQKTAFKKTMLDLSMLMGCIILAGALGGGDDKDKPWFENEVILQLNRFRGDIAFYVPVLGLGDQARILNNPTVTQNTVSHIGDFVHQLVTGPTDVYERKIGLFDKGDSKLKAKLYKMTPVIRQINSWLTPEEQNKIFNKY